MLRTFLFASSFDMHVHIGDVVTTLIATLILWAIHKLTKVVHDYIERQKERDTQLDATSQMVDRHTMVLRKHGLMGPPAGRVYHGGRRKDDLVVDILTDDAEARI